MRNYELKQSATHHSLKITLAFSSTMDLDIASHDGASTATIIILHDKLQLIYKNGISTILWEKSTTINFPRLTLSTTHWVQRHQSAPEPYGRSQPLPFNPVSSETFHSICSTRHLTFFYIFEDLGFDQAPLLHWYHIYDSNCGWYEAVTTMADSCPATLKWGSPPSHDLDIVSSKL